MPPDHLGHPFNAVELTNIAVFSEFGLHRTQVPITIY